MRFLLVFHLAVGAAGTAMLAAFDGSSGALSFAIGAGISWLNLLALVVTWPWILAKKLVALSTAAIVLKFAILVSIMYAVSTSKAFQIIWIAAGMATVVVSVVATALYVSWKTAEQEKKAED